MDIPAAPCNAQTNQRERKLRSLMTCRAVITFDSAVLDGVSGAVDPVAAESWGGSVNRAATSPVNR